MSVGRSGAGNSLALLSSPILSESDQRAPSYREMMAAIEPWQGLYSV